MDLKTKTVQDVFDFIDEATKNRKYSPDVATSIRVSLRLVQLELNEEEKKSLTVFKDHLAQVLTITYNKNKNRISASTFERYKRRINQVLKDYENYADNPTKMAAWNPASRIQKPKTSLAQKPVNHEDKVDVKPDLDEKHDYTEKGEMTKFELALRPNIRVFIQTPADITVEEVQKVKIYIESLEKLAELNK